MQVQMGQTANGRGAIPIKSLMHRHYHGLVLVAAVVRWQARMYASLARRLDSSIDCVLVPPLRTFVVLHKPRRESQILLDGCGFLVTVL